MEQEKTLLRHLRRDRREISLDKLAADTGINVSTLSRAERRLMPLTDENLAKLAAYFGVERPAALLEDFSKSVAA